MLVSVQQGNPVERLAAWRHRVSQTLWPAEVLVNDEAGFHGGTIRMSNIGSLMASHVSADAEVLVRSPHAVATAPGPDFYKLTLQIQGTCVLEQGGKEALLRPGDFAIFDTRRPYSLAYEKRYRNLFLMVPPELLPFDEGCMERVGAVRMQGQRGLEALVSGFLGRLSSEAEFLSGHDARGLDDNVISLLTTLLNQYFERGPTVFTTTRRRTLVMQIQHYIEKNLADPALTPTSVAEAHYISRRYLHKIFEREGCTVAAWIRRRRLEMIYRDLANPLLAELSVSAVGARWGLVNASRFSRVFRDAYGHSPSEHRFSALHQSAFVDAAAEVAQRDDSAGEGEGRGDQELSAGIVTPDRE
jgi:AraC-like DNA-binding protein